MTRLLEKYQKEVVPKMKKIFNLQNNLAVPKITKVTLNVGLSRGLKDEKFRDLVTQSLKRISGQKPVETRAKKSISEFKIGKNQIIGLKVTLRGKRMYEFIDRLVNVALPRVRDFRGLNPKSLDPTGNLNIGFSEHIVFPEIKSEEVEHLHGLEVAVTTSASDSKVGLALLKLFGFPFQEGE